MSNTSEKWLNPSNYASEDVALLMAQEKVAAAQGVHRTAREKTAAARSVYAAAMPNAHVLYSMETEAQDARREVRRARNEPASVRALARAKLKVAEAELKLARLTAEARAAALAKAEADLAQASEEEKAAAAVLDAAWDLVSALRAQAELIGQADAA